MAYKIVNADTLDAGLTTVADAIRAKAGIAEALAFPDGMAEAIANFSALNFSVVGGTTQPASPTENTIWINTDQTITDWILSPDEPESPVEGMVWIRTGSVGTQIEGVNGAIILHISYVSQYADGWEEKNSDIYQGGVWLMATQTRFYFLGDNFESVTGGYTAVGNYTKLLVLQESMVITGSSSTLTRFRSVNPIDMTPFRSLVFAFDAFTFKNYTSTSSGNLVTSQVGVGTDTAAQPLRAYSTPAKQSTPQLVEVDVSGVTGSHYICISAGNLDGESGICIITAIYAY